MRNIKKGWSLEAYFGLGIILFIAYMLISYIINFVQLTECDFEEPYKCEVIHAVGLLPPLQAFTVWFDDDEVDLYE